MRFRLEFTRDTRAVAAAVVGTPVSKRLSIDSRIKKLKKQKKKQETEQPMCK